MEFTFEKRWESQFSGLFLSKLIRDAVLSGTSGLIDLLYGNSCSAVAVEVASGPQMNGFDGVE